MGAPRTNLIWLARGAAMAFTLFISMFAMDVFDEDHHASQQALDLLMHLLPSVLCLLVIIFAWKREWIGGVVFIALAAVYTWRAWGHASWIALIALPLLIIGVLYFVAWRQRKVAA